MAGFLLSCPFHVCFFTAGKCPITSIREFDALELGTERDVPYPVQMEPNLIVEFYSR